MGNFVLIVTWCHMVVQSPLRHNNVPGDEFQTASSSLPQEACLASERFGIPGVCTMTHLWGFVGTSSPVKPAGADGLHSKTAFIRAEVCCWAHLFSWPSSKLETYKLLYKWVRAMLLNAVYDASKIQKGIQHSAFSLMIGVILFNNLGSLCFRSLNS